MQKHVLINALTVISLTLQHDYVLYLAQITARYHYPKTLITKLVYQIVQ